MFGYILPEKPDLKIKEYELFKAYYCGVCKSIGKRWGHVSRLILNYDSTFLAILLSAATGEKASVSREICIVHPLKKRKVIKNNKIIDYASDINIILAYYNLMDNWNDEHSIPSGLGALALRKKFRKLKKKYKEKCDIIESKLIELKKLESEKCGSMDRAAEPFARIMEEVVAHEPLCDDEKKRKILKWIGYNLGKWIYILDAYDDLEDDIRRKTYNPLINQYEYKNEGVENFKSRIKERVEFNLTYCLNQIAGAYELLEIKNNKGIIENILYMGMLRKTEQILNTGSCREIEKSV
ncbi:MAG TPA: hypothetical protein GXX14_05395 [Clostridiaceae bacterium]|nr:hypothetical protein [Clostridiaceae bacterium]